MCNCDHRGYQSTCTWSGGLGKDLTHDTVSQGPGNPRQQTQPDQRLTQPEQPDLMQRKPFIHAALLYWAPGHLISLACAQMGHSSMLHPHFLYHLAIILAV